MRVAGGVAVAAGAGPADPAARTDNAGPAGYAGTTGHTGGAVVRNVTRPGGMRQWTWVKYVATSAVAYTLGAHEGGSGGASSKTRPNIAD
jgi:hypothetical protein